MNSFSKKWIYHGLILTAGICGLQSVTSVFAVEDATALMARVLETNKPWLFPKPAQGTYRIWQRADGAMAQITGPFSMIQRPKEEWVSAAPYRVGSLFWTPLHAMARNQSTYSLSAAVMTNWNRLNVVAVNVTFHYDLICRIAMGGQGNTAYTHRTDSKIRRARILIEPTNAVPVYIETRYALTNLALSQQVPTWQFDPLFLPVDGGLAPSSFDWNEPSSFLQHQQFQVIDDVWIFKRGDAWYGTSSPFGLTGHIQTVELINLKIYVPVTMTVRRAGDSLTIALPPDKGTGFGIESADRPQGPWWPIPSQVSPSALSFTVTIPADKSAQFYRLWRQ